MKIISFKKNIFHGFIGLLILSIMVPVAFAGPSIQKYNYQPSDVFNLSFKAKPGETVYDYVTIQNNDEKIGTYELSVIDAISVDGVSPEGEKTYFSVNAPQNVQEKVGRWGSVEEPNFELMPNENKVLKVSFTIPENTPSGEYWGAVNVLQILSGTKEELENGNAIQVLNATFLRTMIEVVNDETVAFVPRVEAPVPNKPESNYVLLYVLSGLVVLGGASWGVYKKNKK